MDWFKLKIGTRQQLLIWKELKREGRTFENALNLDRVTGKDVEKNKKVYNLNVKEDLFCREELVTVPKGLKNNKNLLIVW